MKKRIVSKFGGTSMGNAECMVRSAEVSLKQDACMVVVSATSGTTNLLIELSKTAEKKTWPDAELLLNKIRENHLKIAMDLKITDESHQQLQSLLAELESLTRGIHLLKDCSAKAFDYIQSFGERLSSLLFTEALSSLAKKQKS